MKAREIFKSVVKGRNFMTPNVLGYYKIKNGAVELSTGKGFTDNMLYGVTVVKDNEHNHELSQVFYSELKAERIYKIFKKNKHRVNFNIFLIGKIK